MESNKKTLKIKDLKYDILDVTESVSFKEHFGGINKELEIIGNPGLDLTSLKVIDVTSLFSTSEQRLPAKMKFYIAYLPVNYVNLKHPWKWARKRQDFMIIPYVESVQSSRERLIGGMCYYYLFLKQYKQDPDFVWKQIKEHSDSKFLTVEPKDFLKVVIGQAPKFPFEKK